MKPRTIFILIFVLLTISAGSRATSVENPSRANCCFFYPDECGSSGDWKWSKIFKLSNVPRNYDYFEWSNVNGSSWESPLQTNVTSGTTFTFQYYMNLCGQELVLGFRDPSTGLTNDIGRANSACGTWWYYSFNCSSCCGSRASCEGQIIITFNMTEPEAEAGIDSFGRDTWCYGDFECCLFDDPSLCGCVSDFQDGYQWLFSGDQPPTYPVPSSGSDFVYLEILNNSSPLKVSLQTPLIELDDYATFYFNCYIPTSASGLNSMFVYYYNVETEERVELQRTSTTSSEWIYMGADIEYACVGPEICTGYLEFVVHVNSIGSHVLFAIDTLSVGTNQYSGCE